MVSFSCHHWQYDKSLIEYEYHKGDATVVENSTPKWTGAFDFFLEVLSLDGPALVSLPISPSLLRHTNLQLLLQMVSMRFIYPDILRNESKAVRIEPERVNRKVCCPGRGRHAEISSIYMFTGSSLGMGIW